jgi:type IV pilus assembly protein PilC
MAVYVYRAVSSSGKLSSGRMPALNERELEARLRNAGLELISAKAQNGQRKAMGRGGVPRKELINLCFHLEQTLRGGVLLTDALADLVDGVDDRRMRDALSVVLEAVREGAPLSKALGEFPAIFDEIFVGLVAAGEEAGTLPESFRKLGEGLRWADELSSQITKMMLYPTFTIVVLIAVAMFMMLYLVPQLSGFIKSAVGELPPQTKLMLAISEFVVAHWGKMLLTPFVLAGSAWIFIATSGEETLRKLDRLKFKLPMVGSVMEKVALARFTSLFSMLYASGVPILKSLDVCKGAAGNRHLAAAIAGVQELIMGGKSLSQSFEISGLFPNLVMRMIRIGETTGDIDKSLNNVTYFYNREIQERIGKIQAMIEPMLTVSMGLLMGWLMMSVLGPVYDILGKLKI